MVPQVRRRLLCPALISLAALGAVPAAAQVPFGAPQPVPVQGAFAPPQGNYAASPSYPLPAAPSPLIGGDQETQTVVGARQALDQFFAIQMETVPPAMLQAAEGIAIFPNMIKGGFILGVNYGRGVLMVRNQDRTWSPPVMVTMGGGSIGFQAGVQAADIVLVFATPRSLQGILNGQKVTLGADASIAAGPVGRSAVAGTDARLGAEIYSYARSRGLFAGVSLGGSDLSVDNNANAVLYGRFGVTPADVFYHRGLGMRPEVQALIDDVNARSRPQPVPVTVGAALPQQAVTPFGGAAPAPVPGQPLAVPVAPFAPPQPAFVSPITPVPVTTQGVPGFAPTDTPPLVPISAR